MLRLQLIKYIFLIITFLFVISCDNDGNEFLPVSFIINSPKSNWIYYYDEIILFSINHKTSNITWESSLDGFLGSGNHLYTYLTPGLHTIIAKYKGSEELVTVNILNRDSSDIRNLVTGMPFNIKLNTGIYFPYIASLASSSIDNFNLSGYYSEFSNNNNYRVNNIKLKDIRMEFNGKIPENNLVRTRAINEKSFYVESTSQQGAPSKTINFFRYYEGDIFNLWVDKNNINTEALENIISEINKVITYVIEFWGNWADIDGDKKIAILVTDVINKENIACGFFNPYDLFPRDLDTSSLNFNPTSNEMDIVYIAMPNNNIDDNYYYKRIVSTLIHELTHVITFSKKTFGKVELWNLGTKREILSIDEGLSHLSECLAGYSVSGDNVKFINYYLESTGFYSLFGRSADGLYDSVGMRGGITLFLSWLFWETGGFEWDKNGKIIDLGGIKFLRALIGSDNVGPDNISYVVGKPVEQLFQDMISKINTQRLHDTKYKSILHPVTGEPMNLFPKMEYFNNIKKENEFIIFPVLYNDMNGSYNSLMSWSFVFFEPIVMQQPNYITLTAGRLTGRIFLNFGKK